MLPLISMLYAFACIIVSRQFHLKAFYSCQYYSEGMVRNQNLKSGMKCYTLSNYQVLRKE